MLEVLLECTNTATNTICESDIVFAHSKKEAQRICEERNKKGNVNELWSIGCIEFID